MLPNDIATCLRLSDIYGVVRARGIEERMREWLIDLMLTDRSWGSVVESDTASEPICFGSCIFISDGLARELEQSKHPFLLADLCTETSLRSHILTFEEIKVASRKSSLNFFGGLFTFARIQPGAQPVKFVQAMNHLQDGLLTSMAGFGIKSYFKQTYESNQVARWFKNSLMRKKFGAEHLSNYSSHEAASLGSHSPNLFGYRKADPLLKMGTPVGELLYSGVPELGIPASLRMALKLELDGLAGDLLAQALGKGEGTLDSNWASGLSKLNMRMDRNPIQPGRPWTREAVRSYIRNNRHELDVLPHLGDGEKAHWRSLNLLPSKATCGTLSPRRL